MKNMKNKNESPKDNLTEIIKISPQRNELEENIKNINDNDKKIMTKKIVYHGQIKRKRNIKNAKVLNSQNKEMNNQNKFSEDINKNLNINNAKKELNNNTKVLNSRINNNSTKYKKINSKPNSKPREFFYNKNKGNPIYHQITPKKTLQKKKIDLNLNDNQNYSINNNQKINDFAEKNKYITLINRDSSNNNNIQNDLSKKIIITEEDNLNNKNIIQQIKPTIKKATINSTNQEDNFNNYNTNNNNKSFKKFSNKDFKTKNYYGYDERHNLEGTINNHSYYVSVYSRKKINQKNNSIDKINN